MSPSSEENESFRDEVGFTEFLGEFETETWQSESVSRETLLLEASGDNL